MLSINQSINLSFRLSCCTSEIVRELFLRSKVSHLSSIPTKGTEDYNSRTLESHSDHNIYDVNDIKSRIGRRKLA